MKGMNGKRPKIRFPEFTDDWEERKFTEGVSEIGDGLHGTPIYSDNGDVFFINGNNLIEGKIVINPETKSVDGNQQSFSDKSLDDTTILMSINGTIGNLAYYSGERLMLGKSVAYMKVSNFDKGFVYAYLQAPSVQSYFMDRLTGTTIKNLGLKVIREMNLFVPQDMEEQKKIGKFFSDFDKHIVIYQKKLEHLQELKKSLLQKMFPKKGEEVPEVRFPGFSRDWEQRKLGDMVSFSKGSGYSKGDLKEDGTPIILYGRLYTKYETVISEVDTFADEKKGAVFSKGGEVIVPASGETAEDISIASVVEKSGVLLGGDLNIITPADDMDPAFLAISISNGKPHNDMAKMAQGKSVVHLHNSDLEKIDLPYPSYAEQRRISGFFSDLDHLITLHQRKLEHIKELKNYMLQNMFV